MFCTQGRALPQSLSSPSLLAHSLPQPLAMAQAKSGPTANDDEYLPPGRAALFLATPAPDAPAPSDYADTMRCGIIVYNHLSNYTVVIFANSTITHPLLSDTTVLTCSFSTT